MPTIVLVLAIVGATATTAVKVDSAILAIKAAHHHTTLPLYHHVLKPVGNAIAGKKEECSTHK